MNYGALSLLPILVCLFLVFTSKNALISIFGGIFTGSALILIKEQSIAPVINAVATVFKSTATLQIIFFVILVGALSNAMTQSGGVNGLIRYFDRTRSKRNSTVAIQLCTMMIGMLMFVDASSSMAITAVVGKPLFQSAKLPKEKLALITNSTAAPIAWIVPFGGTGAMTTGILMQIEGFEDDTFSYVLQAIPFQFYTISLLLFLVSTIVLNFEIGPMKKVNFVHEDASAEMQAQAMPRAINMIAPTVVLVSSIFGLLFVTGKGDIFSGNGAGSVFYGGVIAIVFSFLLYQAQSLATIRICAKWFYDGMKTMIPITMLLLIAFIFSNILAAVRTAYYLIHMFDGVSVEFLPLFIFLIASAIAYCTGTSSGTVAIVTPLVIPMAVMQGVGVPLALGAIISGAVFGDQNAIISDSVILTSSVTDVDVISHVKTQMPYTMVAFSISCVLYLMLGLMN